MTDLVPRPWQFAPISGARICRILLLAVTAELVFSACAPTDDTTGTTPPSSDAATTLASRELPGDTVDQSSTTTVPTTTAGTVVAPTTTATRHSLPIDGDWSVAVRDWPVQPACCDAPAIAPASPIGTIPTDGQMPADGFYDATITRTWDPPGVVGLTLRRWVPCTESPDSCPADPPENGVFSDPATEVNTYLELNLDLTVVIQPLQTWDQGTYPDPPQVLVGSGWAFYELLSGWCSGYLPERNPENCGIDHAFVDWIWVPHQAGASIERIITDLRAADTGPTFPFGEFDDQAEEQPCTGYRCITAYRGPKGTHLIVDFTLLELGENWLDRLYGWWTSLEIRDGKPILYIDAGRLAG